MRNGGDQIQSESDEHVAKHGPVKTGSIAVTRPGNLPCQIVIHAVGKNIVCMGWGVTLHTYEFIQVPEKKRNVYTKIHLERETGGQPYNVP